MSSKMYITVTREMLNNRLHATIHKFKVSCVGGETLPKEMPKISYVDVNKIPARSAFGKQGTNWKQLFESIPSGKAFHITQDDETYKIATVIIAVRKINKDLDTPLFVAEQRNVDGIKHLYVRAFTDETEE